MYRVLFLLVTLILMLGIDPMQASGQCHTVERSIGGMYLRGRTFTTIHARSLECYFKCEENISCQSYNVIIGQNVCELNDRTKEARPGNFIADQKRFYMKRVYNRVPLGSIKGLPAESCSEVKASEGMAEGQYWIYSTTHGQVILAHCDGNWQRINDAPVCFGAKNDNYGSFNVTKSGQLKTMKLLHRSGQIKCNSHTAVSYWGCTHQRYADKKLMTFITNDKRETMFPPGHGLEAFRKGDPHIICLDIKHFYTLEGANHTSPELVFPDPSSPVSVSRDQELQIWYGQDWKGCGEKDNSGEVCVDVYAWYL